MAHFEVERARQALHRFQFSELFIEYLGWNRPPAVRAESVTVDGVAYTGRPLAQLGGVFVFEVTAGDGQVPEASGRAAVHKHIAARYHENILIFLDGQRRQSVWYWVKRQNNKAYPRSHFYLAGQSGDLLLSKIAAMFVDIGELDEQGKLPVVESARRVQVALDVERVTKRFYDEFKLAHEQLLAAVGGIDNDHDRRWYTSALLNRLMFVYFLQKKGLLDRGDYDYLQHKLAASRQRGQNRYYTQFLRLLFFEGFARPEDQRSLESTRLLGEVRYLNGGLFLPHPVEDKYPHIAIADDAFEALYRTFGRYSWHLDDRPGGRDDEINPEILGYIFEKYINQKAFGAYYTRQEITEYLCQQTIHRLVLDKMAELNRPLPGQPTPPRFDSVGDDLLLKLDATRCKQLLFDVLPSLKLLDPACGSGAFLVAAMKTLLEIYLPILRLIPDLKDRGLKEFLDGVLHDHPSLAYYVKKRIISDNLFGVDIMDEAVEIARLRLFLALVASAESISQLEPLPNIDFNILPGNSLVGSLRVNEDAYQKYRQPDLYSGPVRAYRGVVSEKTAMVYRYRNAAEREELKHNPDAVRALRDQIQAHRRQNKGVLDKMLLDEFAGLGLKFEQATWDGQKQAEGKAEKRALRLADLAPLQPFHWGYEFDEVMNERGGFDAIITNPPWEALKPQAKEFFAEHSDLVTKNKMRIEAFESKKAELLRQPAIRAAWLEYLSRFPHQSAYYRSAAQYEHQSAVVNGRRTGSDLNYYKLFTEQCFNLLRDGGLGGIVIPSGIYTDLGATGLRQMLFERTQVVGLFGFENRKGIFEDVHRSFKFVVLAFRKGGRTDRFPARFMRHDPAELAAFPDGALTMPVALVRRLSPEPLSLMEFSSPLDVRIAEKMLAFPLLGESLADTWNLAFTREFDMTNDSQVFRTAPGPNRLPLYEGKMIHQFTHTFAPPRYWVEEREGRQAILGRKRDGGQLLDYQTYRLGFRDIAASTNERTLLCTIIPPAFHGNKLPTVHIFDDNGSRLIDDATQLFICGIWNSFILDWQIRQKITTTLNYFYLYQLAMPRFTPGDASFGPIVERAAQLICTTPEFDDLARAVGLRGHQDGVTDPAGRARLRAELDGLVAHVYGLTEAEFAHVLAAFPLVADSVKIAALNAYRDVVRGLIP